MIIKLVGYILVGNLFSCYYSRSKQDNFLLTRVIKLGADLTFNHFHFELMPNESVPSDCNTMQVLSHAYYRL